jgi:hypothetical protein
MEFSEEFPTLRLSSFSYQQSIRFLFAVKSEHLYEKTHFTMHCSPGEMCYTFMKGGQKWI